MKSLKKIFISFMLVFIMGMFMSVTASAADVTDVTDVKFTDYCSQDATQVNKILNETFGTSGDWKYLVATVDTSEESFLLPGTEKVDVWSPVEGQEDVKTPFYTFVVKGFLGLESGYEETSRKTTHCPAMNVSRAAKGTVYTVRNTADLQTRRIRVADIRYESSITVKENASVAYTSDIDALKASIIKSVIDTRASVLPKNLEGVSVKYLPKRILHSEYVAIDKNFVVGEYDIKLTYSGNEDFTASTAYTKVKVNKGNLRVNVKDFANVNFGERLPEDFITVDSTDNVDIWTVYVGTTSNLQPVISIDFPQSIKKVLEGPNFISKLIIGKSFSDVLRDGMSFADFKKMLTALKDYDMLNILPETVTTIIDVINKVPGIFDELTLAFGTPLHAGFYTATAIASSSNYNVGVGVGSITVHRDDHGTLRWNKDLSSISSSELANFDMAAEVYNSNDKAQGDSKAIAYSYTGYTYSNIGRLKIKVPYLSGNAPTKPGHYTQTAFIKSGDLKANSISRTFDITE